MRTPFESSMNLDRGGKPSVRELLSSLVFNPVDGTIHLNGERIVIQRAAVGVDLRRELIRTLGRDAARVFLMRLGYLSGRADARFVRGGWPTLDIGDAFTAGTRLHMFSGVVRVEVVHNDFDFRRKRFSGEFLWHDSVEAAEFRRVHQRTGEPACWTQLGYASGYASEFFDTLIVYKEVECAAEGHRCCRVVGKPAAMWGDDDPEVTLFRDRVAPPAGPPALPMPALREADASLPALDRILLAPVSARLARLAAARVPVVVSGPAGSGRWRAVRHLHWLAGGAPGDLQAVAAAAFGEAHLADLGAPRRKGGRAGLMALDTPEAMAPAMQDRLARALSDAAGSGARLVAVTGPDPRAALTPALWLALAGATLAMPPLSARPQDRVPLAEALLPDISAQLGLAPPPLAPDAAALIAADPWPGNLPDLRATLTAALLAGDGGALTAAGLRAARAGVAGAAGAGGLAPWVEAALDAGGLSLADLEAAIYAAATARTGGNLSAAARLLGLTRAQLAYRLGRGADG